MVSVKRRSYSKIAEVMELPNLLSVQLDSFRNFLQADVPPAQRKDDGLQKVFKEVFPISDTRENYALEFVNYCLGEPKYTIDECQERDVTFAAPLKATLRLIVKETQDGTKEIKDIIEQEVYLGEIPLITEKGTFIINGAERVVVSQLHRSPGVFFDESIHPNGKKLYAARIIPYHGSWVEFSLDVNDIMYVHIDRKRKIPVTVLLRAIGFSMTDAILNLYYDSEVEKGLKSAKRGKHPIVGRYCAETVVDKSTGEILIEAGEEVTSAALESLKIAGVDKLAVTVDRPGQDNDVLRNTLRKDTSRSEEEALMRIYNLLRPGDPPTVDAARSLLHRLLFSPKRYDLGRVGRYKLNQRLSLGIPIDVTILTKSDFVEIIRYLLVLKDNQGYTDDIDHLGNRRVRSVGELLANQFSIGLTRMARIIKERMSLQDTELMTPSDLVNARTVAAVIKTFFGSSQLSQFMDQTNPLAELTHKRRLSALGPGGLTRERAGFEVRDVHYTHYGRVCPIETPEGPNIGLISSLSTYARINEFGFLETPYRKVRKGVATREVEFLTADREDQFVVAQGNAPVDRDGKLASEKVFASFKGDFPLVDPDRVDYMDVSPKQIVSAAAALIPFLEHDDANRALMGSNMQRQAVPLLITEAPLVGTGLEGKVAADSGDLVFAQRSGIVDSVAADSVSVSHGDPSDLDEIFGMANLDTYKLVKFTRSNQDTCVNQRPVVKAGDRVSKGQLLADGSATRNGELALGVNLLAAFLPWRGYNYEDAILISERVVKEDRMTSIHIEDFELQVRETKRGVEEITREIPNVSDEAVANLDDSGIVRIGAHVRAGDILVGKVTPKGETELTPEERLLKAIFGEKACDVRDASLKAPPGMDGIVIDVRVFSRKERDESLRKREKKQVEQFRKAEKRRIKILADKRDERLREMLKDAIASEFHHVDGSLLVKAGKKLSSRLLERIEFSDVDFTKEIVKDRDLASRTKKLVRIVDDGIEEVHKYYEKEIEKLSRGDELPPGVVKLVKVYIAKKRKLSVGDKIAGRHGNKGVVARIVPEEDMPYLPDGTAVEVVLNPLGVPSRMNLGQILETHLGWAAHELGIYVATPVFDGASIVEIKELLKQAGLPESGKTVLYDGKTGEPLDKEVTVGYIYMMKLSHLVDDKIHARSIGPYSLVTQQPLGGKAQFGGQRFGEMEVWALEAYGSAYALQEILTVKSDDVSGRSRIYEAIVKGENPPQPGIPESFNVLIKELQSLGLDVQLEE
ncbi:MAG TPA: DNA-directed RNA polymerase subunit beta [bacterium]|nr:DNA-directed RNA polymerase subunit beta [bacterium]